MPLTREEFFQKIDSFIRSDGFAFIYISPEAHAPSFSYTVGLTETYGCAELMIFGVGEKIANVVFRTVVEKIKGGARFKDGDVLVDVLNLPCAIKQVLGEAARPFALNVVSRYEEADYSPTFQQIIYPDKAGVFPWQTGYDESMRKIQRELWRRGT
jgi:hypothetical protein